MSASDSFPTQAILVGWTIFVSSIPRSRPPVSMRSAKRLLRLDILGSWSEVGTYRARFLLGPQFIASLTFFKPADGRSFVAATELQPAVDLANARHSYNWHLFLSPFILPDPATPLEMWVYNLQSNEFVKIHQMADDGKAPTT